MHQENYNGAADETLSPKAQSQLPSLMGDKANTRPVEVASDTKPGAPNYFQEDTSYGPTDNENEAGVLFIQQEDTGDQAQS